MLIRHAERIANDDYGFCLFDLLAAFVPSLQILSANYWFHCKRRHKSGKGHLWRVFRPINLQLVDEIEHPRKSGCLFDMNIVCNIFSRMKTDKFLAITVEVAVLRSCAIIKKIGVVERYYAAAL